MKYKKVVFLIMIRILMLNSSMLIGQCDRSHVKIGELNNLGPYGAQMATFQKTNLDCHDSVNFEFQLRVENSWDGNGNHCCGPDIFQIIADNIVIYQTTFSLTGGYGNRQSYPAQYNKSNLVNNAQGTGRIAGGSGWDRYVLKFSFAHNASDLKIQIAQPASQGISDEAWYLEKFAVNMKTCKGGVSIVKDFDICTGDTLSFGKNRYSRTGVYFDTIKTTGCDTFLKINIKVMDKPLGIFSGPAHICQNDTTQLIEFAGIDSSATYIYSYRLNNSTLQRIVGGKNNRVTLSIPSIVPNLLRYKLERVEYFNNQKCFNNQFDSIITVVHALPKALISNNQVYCQNDTGKFIELTGYNSKSPYSLSYQTNNDPQNVIVSDNYGKAKLLIATNTPGTTKYRIVKITDSSPAKCSSFLFDSCIIVISDLPSASVRDNLITCEKDSITQIDFTASGFQSPYTFYYQINAGPTFKIVSNTSTNNKVVDFPLNKPGIFKINLLKVSDGSPKQCENNINKEIIIKVHENPIANFTCTPAEIYQNTDFVYFSNVSQGKKLSYQWTFNNQFFSNLQNPQKSFRDTGKYVVMLKVVDTNNCMDKKEIEIVVNENFNVFIPNVFTPNLNSRNDYFFPICTGVLNIEFIKIFNRWGEMLHDSQNNWDGSYLGQMVPEGIYVYEICVRDKKRSKHYYNGTVHVMR